MMSGLRICIITIFLTGIYLAASITLSNIFFFCNANGSLIKHEGRIIGSKLIGQLFESNIYFHGRPSANNYKNDISGSSNFPYYSSTLKEYVHNNYKTFLNANSNSLPDLNLIVESASGLDPHITYKGAIAQIDRVSKETGISKENITNIVNKLAKPRILGIFGEKILNTLEVNLEIKKELHAKASGSR